MQINVPQVIKQADFKPVPSEYYSLMKRVADIFAARSGLTINWNDAQGGYPVTVVSNQLTLNGILRTNVAWHTSEFFPDNFVNVGQTTLTAEQGNYIISKLLEICDVNGIIYDHKINLNGTYSYASTNSVLSNAKNSGIVPQFFEASILDKILSALERESYTSDTSSCRAACTGLCVEFCGVSCTGICGGSCDSSCIGYCSQSCVHECSSTCALNCSADCYGQCTNLCVGICSDMCRSTCTDACNTTCAEGCENSCTGGCTKSCNDTCAKSCDQSCVSECLGTCKDSCQGQCSSACTATCAQTCKDGCNKLCATTCTSTCEDLCKSSCGDSCIDGCGKACGTTCTGACDGEADAYHAIDDNYADSGNRD